MAYGFESRVRYSEVGTDRRLRLTSLIDYFQDCSTFHSESMGVGFDYLVPRNQAWLLASWQIIIERYPELGEHITIATWPYEFKGAYGLRNFMMKDERGEKLAYANSIWIMADTKTGKIIRPDEVQHKAYPVEPKLDMDYAPRKIRVSGDFEQRVPFKVQRHNLDTNGHVNNGQYVMMARDCIPADFVIRQLRAEYKLAAVEGDMIYPGVCRGDGTYIVMLNNSDGKQFAIVEFK